MNKTYSYPVLTKTKVQLITFIHSSIILILFIINILINYLEVPEEDVVYSACIVIFIVSCWSIYSWCYLSKQIFDPYVIIFTAAVVFNAGQGILEVFKLNKNGILNSFFSQSTVFETLTVVLAGLLFFHLGAILSVAKYYEQKYYLRRVQIDPVQYCNECRTVGYMMLAISTLPTILIVKNSLQFALNDGYSAVYENNINTGFDAIPRVLSGFFIPGILFLLAGSKSRRIELVLSVLLVSAYAAAQILIGARSKAMMPIIAYAWLWHTVIRPLPKKSTFVLGLFTIFFMFPLVGIIRAMSGDEKFSSDVIINSFESLNNPFVASISEMGMTMQTISYTLDLVPSYRDFDWGKGYLYAMLSIIPNFFWDIHPSFLYGKPSQWLIWTVNPWIATRRGSLGFSFIAEAYLNFGWFGLPVVLSLFGAFFAKLTIWSKGSNVLRLAFTASFLSFIVYFVRQEFEVLVRSLLWYSITPMILVLLLHAVKIKLLTQNSLK